MVTFKVKVKLIVYTLAVQGYAKAENNSKTNDEKEKKKESCIMQRCFLFKIYIKVEPHR